MNFDFLAIFGSILFFIFLIALLAQIPAATWVAVVVILILIGVIKNA